MIGEELKNSYEQYLDQMEAALERPIAFHRCFSKMAGSVAAGLMLSQLWYWTKVKGRGEWIFKTIEEMEEETTLSRREQETARLRLQQIKVLEVERRGLPAKLYYRIDFERVVFLIGSVQTTLADSAKLDRRIPPNKIGAFRQTINTETTAESTSENTQRHLPTAESRQQPEVTPENLMETWNDYFSELPLAQVQALSATRRKKILLRLKEHPTDAFWQTVFDKIYASKFLLGGNDHKWRVNFDWLFENDSNALKIAEGRYDNEPQKQIQTGNRTSPDLSRL